MADETGTFSFESVCKLDFLVRDDPRVDCVREGDRGGGDDDPARDVRDGRGETEVYREREWVLGDKVADMDIRPAFRACSPVDWSGMI